MRVHFVILPGGRQLSVPLLGVGYLASALIQAGYECDVSDYSVGFIGKTGSGYELEDLDSSIVKKAADEITERDGDILALHVNAGNMYFVQRLASEIRRIDNRRYIVVGGPQTTLGCSQLAKCSSIDIICRGEAEQSLVEIAGAISKNRALDDIPGTVIRDRWGNIRETPPRHRSQQLDRFPFPAWQVFDLGKYHVGTELILPAILSRGCQFACIYCTVPRLCRYRRRTIDNFVEELAQDAGLFGARVFRFNDSTFNSSKRLVYQLCRGIQQRKLDIKWGCYAHVNGLDTQILKVMYDSGCRYIYLGIESGCDNMLRLMRRNYTSEEAKEIILSAKRIGIKILCSFLIGFPGETARTLQNTADFIKEAQPDSFYLFPFESRESTPAAALVSAISDACSRWWQNEEFCSLRETFGRLLPRVLLPWQHINMFFRWEEILRAAEEISESISSRYSMTVTGEEQLLEQITHEFAFTDTHRQPNLPSNSVCHHNS